MLEHAAKEMVSFGAVALVMMLQVPKNDNVELALSTTIHATAIYYYGADGRARRKPLEGAVITTKADSTNRLLH